MRTSSSSSSSSSLSVTDFLKPLVSRGRQHHHQKLLQLTLTVLLFGAPVVSEAWQQSCDPEEACLGGRPRTPIGCCPVEAGDDCGTAVGVECDAGLGYQCQDREGNVTTDRGVCAGRYNVHSTDVQTTSVSLEWNDFKPSGYRFEYVLLYRQGTYDEDTSTWELLDIGTQPYYTVTKLAAGTLYFMRMAVWADARATVLGNLSEAYWVTTLSVSHCSHNGEEFRVGQVTENCEDRCTCLATGQMDCTPLCPELELPEMREGCSLVYEEECSCNATEECPNEEAPCEFEGEEYEAGSTVTLGCRSCRCTRGTMSCVYPEECEVLEATEECPHPTATPDPDGGCCPIWTCGDIPSTTTPATEGCQYKGNTYADGAYWTDSDECSSCTCEAGHVSCEVTCEEPVEPEGCVNPVRRTDSSGCCQIIVCDSTGPVEGEEECNYNGTVYRIGDTFTRDCSLCMCVHGNSVNCSFNSCPPTELPVPSILCPFPHVRHDGCCDTVFCMEENVDPQTLMSRLMAISFGPSSLTISFDVGPTAASSPDPVTQDRYEVMTSDRGGDASSWASRTYTAATVDADDNASSPWDLLHQDAAVRVDERVYITLGGLSPNTTYYVRVQPLVKRDMGVTTANLPPVQGGNATLVGFIVARTLGRDLTCRVSDVVYEDGAIVSKNCGEVCKCSAGHVSCESACAEEKVIMAPSPACPRPLLVATEHACCRTWKCFPEEGGCVHGDTMLKNGELVYEGSCDRRCRCTDGTVTCSPVCLPASPAPRARCVLTNVTGSCCPVWMCPIESKPPVSMSLATRVGFRGSCPDKDNSKALIRRAFENRLVGQLPCADPESPYFVQCWVKDVVVTCPLLDAYRRRRQTTEVEVVGVVAANITDSYPVSKTRVSLDVTGSALSAMFSSGDIWLLLEDGQNMTSSGNFLSFGISFDCEKGFVFSHNACVPEYLSPPPTSAPRHNVSMTLVNSSHDSATFAWPSLAPNSLTYVIGLVIQYRETTSRYWKQSMTLHPATTRHTVTSLSASRRYKARLVALTNSTSAPRVSLSVVQFITKSHEVLTEALTFEPVRVSLGLTSVTISWTSLTSDVTSAISKLQIRYRKSQNADDVSSHDLDPRASHVNLVGLASGTAYVSKFAVLLVNGTLITTLPLHFVTVAEESSDVPLIPLLATCAVIVVLSFLLPVAFIVWRRMRRKSTMDTAFENKTYGVNISSLCTTRTKNGPAQPQDLLENASAVASSTDAGDLRTQQA